MKTIDRQYGRRLLMALLVALTVAAAWFAPIDSRAGQSVDAGLKRALVSFATARALNAVISVAQGTEIAVQPAGVGIIFSPGQILDPVNDLVEQFSHLMLSASIAFGIEKVLLSIGGHGLVSLALSLVALGWIALYLRRKPVPAWLGRFLMILLMARFALPLVVIGSDFLFQHFMQSDYQISQQGIDTVSGQLETLNPPAPATPNEAGLLEKLKGWASQPSDLKTRYHQLKQAAEQATERIITLMVIFLLQTLVFPVALLWVLWGLVRKIIERPAILQQALNP
jgi:hypothetical protein